MPSKSTFGGLAVNGRKKCGKTDRMDQKSST